MANAANSNSMYVDAVGQLTTTKNIRVSQIVFTAAAADDVLILKDTNTSGALKIKIQSPTAKQTLSIDFFTPLVFSGGIYVSTITSGATATIVTSGGPS